MYIDIAACILTPRMAGIEIEVDGLWISCISPMGGLSMCIGIAACILTPRMAGIEIEVDGLWVC